MEIVDDLERAYMNSIIINDCFAVSKLLADFEIFEVDNDCKYSLVELRRIKLNQQ